MKPPRKKPPRKPTDEDIERAALRLARVLGDASMAIGALAVSAWGHVRATDDIDFVTKLDAPEVRRRLEDDGIASVVKRGDPLEGDPPWVVRGSVEGIPFDVLPPLVPLDWDRAVLLPLAGRGTLRVVDLEGLIRLKLHAGGPQDLLDVAVLLRKHPRAVAGARAVAEAYGLWQQLDRWLKDPRLRVGETPGKRATPKRRRGPTRKR